MLIIFNWNTIQSIILHSILFNYGSVHICENSNKLGRVTSQSKVENKMALYRAAAMMTTILDLEARRKAKEASLHKAIKSLVSSNHHLSAILLNHALQTTPRRLFEVIVIQL